MHDAGEAIVARLEAEAEAHLASRQSILASRAEMAAATAEGEPIGRIVAALKGSLSPPDVPRASDFNPEILQPFELAESGSQVKVSNFIRRVDFHVPPYPLQRVVNGSPNGHPDVAIAQAEADVITTQVGADGRRLHTGRGFIAQKVEADRAYPWAWAGIGIRFTPAIDYGWVRFTPWVAYEGRSNVSAALQGSHSSGEVGMEIWSDHRGGGDLREEPVRHYQELWSRDASGVQPAEERDYAGAFHHALLFSVDPDREYLFWATIKAWCDGEGVYSTEPSSSALAWLAIDVPWMVTEEHGFKA